jgi:hypothetical protein
MKKLPISKFDLGIIIAFVVIGLLGGGAWYYLSDQLTAAQQSVASAKAEFDRYSSYKASAQEILVSRPNQNILQNNIDLLKGQLVPLIKTKLKTKENKLYSIDKKDPVAWKHNLDDKVRELTAAAGVHSVTIPKGFYFTFSRYLNQNPSDDQTEVLSKQMLAIEQIATILINAPVRNIMSIKRSYEEEPRSSGGGGLPGGAETGDRLGSNSYMATGNAYRVYPYELEFETNTTGFRKVINAFIQSPYIFVVRTVAVQNEQSTSPGPSTLETMVGPAGDNSVTEQAPGVVAATVSTKGPQYLFGNATLHVKIRLDLIEWLTPPPDQAEPSAASN